MLKLTYEELAWSHSKKRKELRMQLFSLSYLKNKLCNYDTAINGALPW